MRYARIKKYDIVCSGTTAAICLLIVEMRFRTPETARTHTNKIYKNSNFRKIMDLTCVSLIVSYSGKTRGFATFRWVLVSGRPREHSGHPACLFYHYSTLWMLRTRLRAVATALEPGNIDFSLILIKLINFGRRLQSTIRDTPVAVIRAPE